MWDPKVSRKAILVDRVGVPPQETCKLSTGCSERIRFSRISPLMFSRQIESVRRGQPRKHFRQVSSNQPLLHSLGALRNHSIRQNIQDHLPQFLILRGSAQKLLAALLIQADRVKL